MKKTVAREYDYKLLKAAGEDLFISGNVEIRRPLLVSAGCHIAIDSGFYCTVGAEMGDYVHIGPYVTVIGGAEGRLVLKGFNTIGAGSRVLCASDEFLGAGLVGMSPPEYRDRVKVAPVIFQMFASVGTNVVIHPGVTLAEGSVVGSCSLVTRSTEPWTIYTGVPARPLRKRPSRAMKAAARRMGYL
jgi:acetyltransferase-like isoleucine patch superfamily enzyme